jgi:hypothetical protein
MGFARFPSRFLAQVTSLLFRVSKIRELSRSRGNPPWGSRRSIDFVSFIALPAASRVSIIAESVALTARGSPNRCARSSLSVSPLRGFRSRSRLRTNALTSYSADSLSSLVSCRKRPWDFALSEVFPPRCPTTLVDSGFRVAAEERVTTSFVS